MADLLTGLGGNLGFGSAFFPSLIVDLRSQFSNVFPGGLSFYGVVLNTADVDYHGVVTLYDRNLVAGGLPFPGHPSKIFPFKGSIDSTYLFPDFPISLSRVADRPSPGGTSQGSNQLLVAADTANHRLVLTWDDVGYVFHKTDLSNAFQLVLQDRSSEPGRSPGDFDIDFRYEAIEWTTADDTGWSGGLGGASAQAGFTNTNNVSLTLPASGNQAALLALPDTPGNTGVPGLWHFEIRNAAPPDGIALQPPSGGIYAQSEGNVGTTPYRFTVLRSGDLSGTVSVNWAVTVGNDYDGYYGYRTADAADFSGGVLPSGTLTFADGQSKADVSVAVRGDAVAEQTEAFALTLSQPVSSAVRPIALSNSQLPALILDDDSPPTLSINRVSSTYEGDSGAALLRYTLSRTGDASADMVVTLSPRTPGGQFWATPDDLVPGQDLITVTIGAGKTSMGFTIGVVSNTIPQTDRSFFVDITGFSGGAAGTVLGNAVAVGLILDDDNHPPTTPTTTTTPTASTPTSTSTSTPTTTTSTPTTTFPAAGIFADPHLLTLDGLAYDFQASGEYVLAESLPGAADPFQVQVRLAPLAASPDATWTTRLAAEVRGIRVEVDAGSAPHLLVNGVTALAGPGGTDLDGDGTPDLYVSSDRYDLRLGGDFNEWLSVQVAPAGYIDAWFILGHARAGLTRGLLGDFDGIRAGDLRTRDGAVLTDPLDPAQLYGDFAASWRVAAPGTPGGEARLFTDHAPVGGSHLAAPHGLPGWPEAMAAPGGPAPTVTADLAVLG